MTHASVNGFIRHSPIASLGTIQGCAGEDIEAVTDIIITIHAVQHITEPVKLFFLIDTHAYNADLILQPHVCNTLSGGVDICRIVI